jgi:hypothetical protein
MTTLWMSVSLLFSEVVSPHGILVDPPGRTNQRLDREELQGIQWDPPQPRDVMRQLRCNPVPGSTNDAGLANLTVENHDPGQGAGVISGVLVGGQVKVTWDVTAPHNDGDGLRVTLFDLNRPDQIVVLHDFEDNPDPDLFEDDGLETRFLDVPADTLIQLPTCRGRVCTLSWIWDSDENNGYYVECSSILLF